MDHLKNILRRVLKSTPNYEENMERIAIYEAWPRVVGERMARHCWPVRMVEDGVLLVAAESSAWLQSIRFLENQILDKFEKELKRRDVKQLRFKLETRNSREY